MIGDFNFDIRNYVIRSSLKGNSLVAIPINDFNEKKQLTNPLFKCVPLIYNYELKQYELMDLIDEIYDYDTQIIIIRPV